jgi:hypothetical protein
LAIKSDSIDRVVAKLSDPGTCAAPERRARLLAEASLDCADGVGETKLGVGITDGSITSGTAPGIIVEVVRLPAAAVLDCASRSICIVRFPEAAKASAELLTWLVVGVDDEVDAFLLFRFFAFLF